MKYYKAHIRLKNNTHKYVYWCYNIDNVKTILKGVVDLNNNKKSIYSPGGKIIRDAVHGDIFVSNKFLEIIDCPEFQRLRRVKQLSVANMLFPSADHTRFSHSIGTYHVMQLLITHFEKQFEAMNIDINQNHNDIALAAALLHDIGHGPFSHAYEEIHPVKSQNIKHEEWTLNLIRKNGKLNSILIKNFGEDFPSAVANLIKDQRSAKRKKVDSAEKIDLFFILSSLISSQLDADRIDYLLRDSMHTGVNFGRVDISRIISSMRITVLNDKYSICIPEKYITDIEQYLLGRYQMHKEVYYHSFKVEMEQIIKKIFSRAYYLFINKKLNIKSNAFRKVFEENTLTIEEYISLDDNILIASFQEWISNDDIILSDLCKALIYREKYKKIKILSKNNEDIELFKNDLSQLLKKYNYSVKDNFKSEYFWIESIAKFSLYDVGKENIWILLSNGVHKDLSEISQIIKIDNDKQWDDITDPIILENKNKVLFEYEKFTYINLKLIKHLIKPYLHDEFENEFEKLVNKYDNRNHIEIEKKYYFDDREIFNLVENFVENCNFEVNKYPVKYQEDLYFDTIDGYLNDNNSTLRFREKDSKYELTIKRPTINLNTDDKMNKFTDTQSARFEDQISVNSKQIEDHVEFISSHTDLKDEQIHNLKEALTIKNKRTKIILSNKEGVEFELVFDDITYEKDDKIFSEYQVEIELKSDYSHRVNLKLFSDELETSVPSLITTLESKFKRGLKLLNTVK